MGCVPAFKNPFSFPWGTQGPADVKPVVPLEIADISPVLAIDSITGSLLRLAFIDRKLYRYPCKKS